MIDIKELRKVIADCYWPISPVTINEILDRLEAAEKERDALLVELKEVRYGVAVAHDTIKALRAKIAEMEKQEPVAWQRLYKDGSGSEDFTDLPDVFERQRSLYTLPGAQPQLNEIKIALQRALELGQREAWTGVRKHRSWEDQREEQQCWNKVWSLLGAKGESE